MTNHILTKEDMSILQDGIDTCLNILTASFGANPGNAMFFAQATGVSVFDDGYRALMGYNPQDVHLRMAKTLVLDAAAATFRACGDGTSTTGILACLLMKLKALNVESNVTDTVDAMKAEVDKIVSDINVGKMDVTHNLMYQVALTAMNGDKALATLVSDLVMQVGQDGIVTAEMSKTGSVYADKSIGIETLGGFASPEFANNGGFMLVRNAKLIFVNAPLEHVKDAMWADIFNNFSKQQWQHPLVVVCLGATGSFLQTFIDNNKKLPMYIAKINSPFELTKIAEALGATVFNPEKQSFKHMVAIDSDFADCLQIKCTIGKTSILPTDKNKIAEVSETLKALIAADNAGEEATKCLSVLNSTFGTIFVPYNSQSEFSEQKESIEDGYNACMQAFYGVVPGGKRFYEQYITLPVLGSVMSEMANLVGESDMDPFDCATTLQTAFKNALSVAVPFWRTRTFISNDY
jgi:TCP-1/cpn60 chaperonin family